MDLEKYKDEHVDLIFKKLLTKLTEDAEHIDVDIKKSLLEGLMEEMNWLDQDDNFGTEGWKHRYGFED